MRLEVLDYLRKVDVWTLIYETRLSEPGKQEENEGDHEIRDHKSLVGA